MKGTEDQVKEKGAPGIEFNPRGWVGVFSKKLLPSTLHLYFYPA